MNAAWYQSQVLAGALKDFWDEMKAQRPSLMFQQDGASAHRAKTTLKWLRDHEIPLMYHPPNSPNLNPIEPVWHELKTRLRARRPPPSSFDTLKQAIFEEWEAMPISDINKYILSMPNRVHAIFSARGGHTRF